MSAEASGVPSTTSSAGTSASRWAKATDQTSGSAFNGLTRGGKPRGTGRGRGGRGSRGGKPQEIKVTSNDASADKKAPAKPAAPSSPSLSTKAPSKPNESSGRPKPSSRRPSRANSTTNSTSHNPVTESTGSTTSTRSSNRRRRSLGKGPPNGLAQIRVPSKDDSLLRPHRQPNVAAPLTAPIGPIKDIASPALDVKHDVDAFVERVRAAAMAEHRPSTPGSHIDWAGDDDDSLPDLDDWGIPSTARIIDEKKVDLMSPLVVDGLTSLPAIEVPPTIEENPSQPEQKATPEVPVPVPQLQISPPSENAKENTAPKSSAPRSPKPPFNKSSPRDSNFPNNNRRDAGRKPPRRSPLSTPTIEQQEKPAALAPQSSESTPKTTGKAADEEGGLSQSIHAPSSEERLRAAGPPSKPEGVAESIHAPDTLLDSTSAPADISVHPSKPSNHRTHARAHTTGRPFRGESSGRGFRGHESPRAPRNELSGGHHNRTRSTPPAGANRGNHQQHMHRERPVLTGDALTRLARSINGSNHSSPNKTPIAAIQD